MPTSLATLLAPSRIRVGLPAETKAEVIEALVDLAATAEAVSDRDAVLAAVLAREALMSTGVGQGVALPHARTEAARTTVAAFATLAAPVAFESLDGEPVRLVALIAGAESERQGHVRLMSRASRVFADEATRERLLAARAPREVLQAFKDAEASLA
ncbi:MAG: PTS sugar transporter subunit IIA [Bacteroidota bacterium]